MKQFNLISENSENTEILREITKKNFDSTIWLKKQDTERNFTINQSITQKMKNN